MKKVVLLTLVAMLGLPFAAAAQSTDVSGNWNLSITSPQGTRDARATFKQDGEKLEGVFKGQRGELPLKGTVKGSEIKFTYTTKFQDNEMLVTFTGNLEGNSLKGKADFGGFAEGEWTGKRDTGAAPAEKAAASASSDKMDVTGSWVFEVTTSAGSGSPTFTFKQDGEKLTGQYRGLLGEASLRGTVKGNEIKYSFDVDYQGQKGTVTYEGKIEKDTMKGTAKLGELGEATWTAKRQ